MSLEKEKVFYNKLKERKFGWTPIDPVVGEIEKGTEQTLGRGLALRVLELPVGQFIKEATKKDFLIPDGCLDLFESNIADEDVHDRQLDLAYKAYNVTSDEDQKTAYQILAQWNDLPDHPILKAGILERSIFFILLPMMRLFGDTSLRTISQDISRKRIAALYSNV